MKRNYHVTDYTQFNQQELSKRVAYHEAGHATAIYLYNKQHNLPPIFFQITVKSADQLARDALSLSNNNIAAHLEGGCLIQDLFSSFNDSQRIMNPTEHAEYYQALDADMINFLAGAIAEAHYVYLRDGEKLTSQMLTIAALRSYGSHSDLVRVDEYLNYLTLTPQHRQHKLKQLLTQTFDFMTHFRTWKAVKAVAQFILTSKKQVIRCEEVFAIIDNATLAI